MKAILIILIVALGGLTYKFQLDAKSAKAKMIAAEDAEHAATSAAKDAADALAEANAKITRLEGDLSRSNADLTRVKDQLAEAEIRFSNRLTETQTAAAENRTAAEVVAGIEAKERAEQNRKQNELTLLNEQYNQALIDLADQRAALVANQEKAKLAYDNLKRNEPKFAEQGSAIRGDNRVATGIRTSKADREEVLQQYQLDLETLTNQIATMKGEVVALDAREKAIKDRYLAEQRRIQGQN